MYLLESSKGDLMKRILVPVDGSPRSLIVKIQDMRSLSVRKQRFERSSTRNSILLPGQ